MKYAVRAIVIRDNALLVMHRNKFGHEYYTLVGGGIDQGETPEQSLHREVMEESGLQITNLRKMFIEDAGAPFGTQYIYLCDYLSGQVGLQPGSEEARINALGSNIYTPMWLPLEQLPDVVFLSKGLQERILQGLRDGWPDQPVHFKHH